MNARNMNENILRFAWFSHNTELHVMIFPREQCYSLSYARARVRPVDVDIIIGNK